MLSAEIIITVISWLGLILNGLTLYITGIRLKFKGIDLILMGLVAVLDLAMSANSIIRILGVWFKWLLPLRPPTNWCIWDAALVFTASQTAIETVAVLGLLRYLAICRGIHTKDYIWISCFFVSLLSSLGLSLGNAFYSHSYAWSKSGLLCLPITIRNAPNHTYFTTWFGIVTIRFIISLLLIVFCYSRVTISYRRFLKKNLQEGPHSNEMVPVFQPDNYNSNTTHSKPPSTLEYEELKSTKSQNRINTKTTELVDLSSITRHLKRQRVAITLQLIGIALLYTICIFPDIVIAFCFTMDKTDVTPNTMAVSHILFAFTSIVNPSFVLVAHEPSRRQIGFMINYFIHPKFKSRVIDTFPYQQH